MNNSPLISILDYGIGNVRSISNAIECVGARPLLTNKKKEILSSDGVIFPGVGAFAQGMANLHKNNLIDSIHSFTITGKLFLGICLGMQMLMDESEEFGVFKGLGLIKGKVVKLPLPHNSKYKLPHISWNSIKSEISWDNTILHGIEKNATLYFVHTFVAQPINKENILANTDYGESTFCSAIINKNIYGVQFHPEKSRETGLKILKNFISLIIKK